MVVGQCSMHLTWPTAKAAVIRGVLKEEALSWGEDKMALCGYC